MGNEQCSPTITGCQFIDNSAGTTNGGAMINLSSSPWITDCEFMDNSATLSGGAIRNAGNSNVTVTGCTFVGNAGRLGGGMNNTFSAPLVTDCVFSQNVIDISSGGGGAIFNHDGDPFLIGCQFTGNTSIGSAGAILASAG